MSGRSPEALERNRALSREAKRRRQRACVRGCGHLVGYENTDGVCIRCRNAESRIWTREAVIAAIQLFANENGRVPYASDWAKASGRWPVARSVYQLRGRSSRIAPFQTWAEAIEAAGFPRPKPGRRPKKAKA